MNDSIFWVPAPWGFGEGPNIIKSQLQSQFQRFLNQTFVFSQIKEIKHIRWDIYSTLWIMPLGLGLGDARGQ